MKKAIINERIIPGATSIPIATKIDDALKRSKNMHQRIQITLRAITRLKKNEYIWQQFQPQESHFFNTLKKLSTQQSRFIASLQPLIVICEETYED